MIGQGCLFCGGSKIAISHWQSQSPLTQGWRYHAARNYLCFYYLFVSLPRPTEWRHPCVRTHVERDGVVGFKQFCTISPHIYAAYSVCMRSAYLFKMPHKTDIPRRHGVLSVPPRRTVLCEWILSLPQWHGAERTIAIVTLTFATCRCCRMATCWSVAWHGPTTWASTTAGFKTAPGPMSSTCSSIQCVLDCDNMSRCDATVHNFRVGN